MSFIRKVKCLGYKALDKFRFSKVASILFYQGQDVKIVTKNFWVHATLTTAPNDAEDGDVTFNVQCDDGHQMHIELTPCSSQELLDKVKQLKVGDRKYFFGERRIDPAHLGDKEAKDEIHPLEDVHDA